MVTETINLAEMTETEWERVAAALAAGGLACLPADTVYGLAGAPTATAERKIYQVKHREARKPLALVFLSVDQIREQIPGLPAAIGEALPQLMPGPLTAILPLGGPLAHISLTSSASIGVRIIPPPMGELYRLLPSPLAVTSANISGESDPACAADIPPAVAAACDFVIDGGPCHHGVPSTVVDLRPLALGGSPIILRAGAMPEAELKRRLGS